MFFFNFDFIIQCTWFNFQGQLTMNLQHDFLLNGAVKASQGAPLHVVDYSNVYSGEVGVGSGNGRAGSGDDLIQSKPNYNELANRDLGEDKEELL